MGKKAKIILCSVLSLLLVPSAVFAESAISQGFTTDEQLRPGTVVSLYDDIKGIEQATTDNVKRLLGVISDTSLVELSDDGANQVQVVTNGRALVLVSDINGEVKAGDYITASPLRGIGMRATESGYAIGTAQADFASMTETFQRTIDNESGEQKRVTLGLLPVQIDVTQYEKTDDKKSILPQFVLNIARAVSGRDVSVVRVLVALLVLLIGTVSIAVMLYATVRSSIASIGRNPLAAAAVNKGLVEISLLTMGMLAIMLGAVYLILVV